MLTIMFMAGGAFAADHIDSPAASADPAADISDLFAWHDGAHLNVVLTYAGLSTAGNPGVYDPDVLYGVHIDNDGDVSNGAEREIWIRFAQDSLGDWGVQVVNLPGAGAPVSGPVEQIVEAPGGRVFAGLRDDPFFFDFTGFTTTLATGTLAFTAGDDFAGTNVSSIVLQMDQNVAADGGSIVSVWATASRI